MMFHQRRGGCLRGIFFVVLLSVMVVVTIAVRARHQEGPFYDEPEAKFREGVEKAIKSVEKVLDNTRTTTTTTTTKLQLAEDVSNHTYQDKYGLAEFMTNTAINSYMIVLEKLGLTKELLDTILDWHHNSNRTVTLRFQADKLSCDFIKKEKAEAKVQEAEIEETGLLWRTTKKKIKVSDFVTEYHWRVTVSYHISVLRRSGNNNNDAGEKNSFDLRKRSASTTIVTTSKKSPISNNLDSSSGGYLSPNDITLNWLLDNIDYSSSGDAIKQNRGKFSIDRSADHGCKTPRRNNDIDQSIAFDQEFSNWADSALRFLIDTVDNIPMYNQNSNSPDNTPQRLATVESDTLFHPIVPILNNNNGPTVLNNDNVIKLQEAQVKAIDEAQIKLTAIFPKAPKPKTEDEDDGYANNSLVSSHEAIMVLLLKHLQILIKQHIDGINYIEDMLRNQLIQAIGKHVTASDFEEYMRYHGKQFFQAYYAPVPFARPVRQPGRFPDGILSIERTGIGNNPIDTLARRIPGGNTTSPIHIPINSATTLEMTGDKYLHGWMQHTWSGSSPSEYQLAARARQFSSFLLIVGSMSGPTEFTPKHAIILRNKDEVLIPLLTEVLPSAKTFRDAISSLSPEQQAFAKGFRTMQLQSSVFGVVVVQLKPQLEKLLNLPSGALTKEIQLTEDLLTMFVEYQIPSDLLSYDDVEDADLHTKVATVKDHVSAVMNVIEETKKKELREAEMKGKRLMEANGTIIGIDFGATYSCVGVYTDGRVQIIANDMGNYITPSYVAFLDNGELLVGEEAKAQAMIYPKNTVFNVRRLIGRNFKSVQSDSIPTPYTIVSTNDNKPVIAINVAGKKMEFTPEQVMAMVLVEMKATAEAFLGSVIEKAVLTAPVYFDDAKRQAMKAAGGIAGLKVERIINAPVAGCIAHRMDLVSGEPYVLVFHLGGRTFDVTLLEIDNGVFDILATYNDARLGGIDFDNRLIQHFIEVVKKKSNFDISNDLRAVQKLRNEVERLKHALSSQQQARLEIEDLFDGIDLNETLTRIEFEELNRDLFDKLMGPVTRVLEDADLSRDEIDEIVLDGGSTRIPKVQQMLSEYFDGRDPSKGINPEEAGAYGAAVQGGILSGETGDATSEILLLDTDVYGRTIPNEYTNADGSPKIQPIGKGKTIKSSGSGGGADEKGEDFTMIPVLLDVKLEKYDADGSLRSATIKEASTDWTMKTQASILNSVEPFFITEEDIDTENNKAFDLLDAISRSGALPIESAEIHIIIAVSHCFEKNIMETVIEDNINPIEKVERSLLMLATTIHDGIPASELFGSDMASKFPELFDQNVT